MTTFDAEGLKQTLKDLQSKENSLVSNAASTSVAGTVTKVSDHLIKYDEVIPAPVRRKIREIPDKGINIKYVNLLLPFVEEYWHGRGRYPETTAFMEHFGLRLEEVQQINTSKLWLACLDRRGIARPDVAQDFLTSKQIAAISLLSNYHDTRHKDIKLASIGCSLEEYQGWLKNSAFKNALSARTDEILNHVGIDANVALAQLIDAKDFRAVKFYFEITGKAASPEAINVKQTMQILIEAIQKHVKDTDVLQSIADEVNQVRAIQGL